MTDFLTYDLKVAVLICVFYMFYRLLLARETFHRVNRVVLILTAVASFVLPLCVITMHKTVTMAAMPEVSIGDVGMLAVTEAEPAAFHWQVAHLIYYRSGGDAGAHLLVRHESRVAHTAKRTASAA